MAKIISLILAVSMMFGCIPALASSSGAVVNENGATDTIKGGASSGSLHTEMWLQVGANWDGEGASAGTIDVTVPLVLVFRTNIDGGSAQAPASYGITNNSSADVAVTGITVNDASGDVLTLEKYGASYLPTDFDRYGVELEVQSKAPWDMAAVKSSPAAETAINGGLFILPKANAGVGVFTPITARMMTSKLSFVTDPATNAKLDASKGLKLMTVSYTVALDLSHGRETVDKDGTGIVIPTESWVHPDDGDHT